MSRTEDRSIDDRVGDLEVAVVRREVLHIRTVVVVMGRDEPWADELVDAASCLEAAAHDPAPVELRRFVDLEVLLDPSTGARRFRHLVDDVAEFDAIAEAAAAESERRGGPGTIEILMTCHEGQVEPLLCDAKVTGLLGGNRAGKTVVGVYWVIRQWLLKGQKDGLGWVVCPDLKRVWRRLVKDLAPRIPAELRVGALPSSYRSSKLSITFVDGCVVEGLHAAGDGGNLKSENVLFILADEVGEWRQEGNWQQVNSRTAQGGARAFANTTPVAGHWSRAAIVLQAPHSGGAIEVFEVDLFDNPWLTLPRIWALFLGDGTLTEVELAEQVLASEDPEATARAIIVNPRSLREHFGCWTADGIKLWAEWTEEVERACTRSGGGTYWPSLPLADGRELPNITPKVAASFFRASKPAQLLRVAGHDFNLGRQSTIVCQIFGLEQDPTTWVLMALEEVLTPGTVETHGARLKTQAPGLAIACDPSGDIPRHEQTSAVEGDDASRLRDMGFDCRSCVGRGRRLPSQKPTLTLLHKLMKQRRVLVHLRCRELLKAFEAQKAKPDGRIDKRSGVHSPSDMLSGPSDGFRYLAWALLRHELERPAQWD